RRRLFPLADSLRYAGGQGDIIGLARTYHDHALVSDNVFANVLAVIATAHFDYDDHLAKLSVDFHITHPDNVIGEKRYRVMTKRQRGKCILHFDRAENRD